MKLNGILPQYWPQTADRGWQCPKCSRVHAPFVTECAPCNKDVRTGGYGFSPANTCGAGQSGNKGCVE